ncbi:MAG TPA: PAS domain S-box protein [Methanoregula sp.]|nr:PAS domain S-box protein [Methanoregula sp.]
MDNTEKEIVRIRDILKSCQTGLTIAEIARMLNLNRISTSKYLNMMVASGEAEMRVHGPSKVYYPCQRVPISTILNFSSEILVVMDDTLTIIDVNNVLLDRMSVKKTDLIGHRIDYSLLASNLDPVIISHLHDAVSSRGSTLKIRRESHGKEYYFQLKFIPTAFESGDHGVTLIAEDITELSVYRQQLEQQVDERSRDLVTVNEQLKKEIANYKKARKELTSSESKYRELVQNSNSIILRMDNEYNINFFNEFAQNFFGWKEDEILGKNIYETIVPAEQTHGKPVKELLTELQKNPAGFTRFVNENIKKNGEKVWISWTNKYILDTEGTVTGILSIGTDITEMKRADEQLKFQNILFTTQNETTIDGILVVDETNKIISYNQRFVDLWGVPRNLIEKKYDAFVLDHIKNLVKDPVSFLRTVTKIYSDHQRIVRDELYLKDGRCFDRYSAPMTGPDTTYYGRIWYFRDTTEQKRYEEKLRASEEKMAAIIDFLPDATFVIDTNGILIAWNRAMEKWTGIPARDVIGLGDYEYALAIHGFRKPVLIDFALNPDRENPGIYTSFKREGNTYTGETFSTYAKREGIWIWGTASPLYDATGAVIGAIESMRDISAIKQTEQALKEREAICSAIVEDQTEMISRFQPDGTYVFVNEAFAAFFNTTKADIVGTQFALPVVEEDSSLLHHYYSGIDVSNPGVTLEIRLALNEGDVRWTRWNIRGLFSPEGKIIEYQAVGRDVTDYVAVKESASYQSQLLNQVTDAIIATDMNARITYWNRAAERLFGWKSREVLGKNVHSLIRCEMKKTDAVKFQEHLMAEGSWKGVLTCDTRSGRHIRVEWSVSVMKDHAGKMTGSAGLCREIPAKKQAG